MESFQQFVAHLRQQSLHESLCLSTTPCARLGAGAAPVEHANADTKL